MTICTICTIPLFNITSGCTGPKRNFKWVLDGFWCTKLRYVDDSSDVRVVAAERFVDLVEVRGSCLTGWYSYCEV